VLVWFGSMVDLGWMDGWIGIDGEAYLRRDQTLWRVLYMLVT
jgi:hypothetical protein